MNLSAQKRVRQNKTRRMHNRMIKSEARTAVKAFEKAVNENDKATAESALLKAYSLLDGAVSKGVFHKNTVSRKKSRLAKVYNAMNKVA